MSDPNVHPSLFRAPTVFARCATDFGHNRCVNVHFGNVVVHLQATDFPALQGTMTEVTDHLAEQYPDYTWIQDTLDRGDIH